MPMIFVYERQFCTIALGLSGSVLNLSMSVIELNELKLKTLEQRNLLNCCVTLEWQSQDNYAILSDHSQRWREYLPIQLSCY